MKQVDIFLTLLSIGWLLVSCEPGEVAPTIAFYHWQTELDLDPSETERLEALGCKRLYVKFFDLVAEGDDLIPRAKLQVGTIPTDSLEIVPTLFLSNASMQHLREQQAVDMDATARLVDRCRQLIGELWPGLDYRELQFDCDWTKQTRETFFAFLRQWRKVLDTKVVLSATLRLHQYRYPEQTGVPPVDRVMLMYYNVGQLEEWSEENSIFSLAAAAPYLETAAYPLPIDLALPLFRWGVLFRNAKVVKLITGLSPERLADTAFFLPITVDLRPATREQSPTPAGQSKPAIADATMVEQPAGSPRYLVRKSTYLDGYYLYAGDLLRLEAIDSHLLLAAAQQWQQRGVEAPRYLSFYHLDTEVLHSFTDENLRDCAQIWLAD
ncbi:MAG: hypothetical protein D6772_12680 [Bacteroidetes bacterium]|nr:MAG: hypothetical protein D6772_12680 [Bacteroidota bacterium]